MAGPAYTLSVDIVGIESTRRLLKNEDAWTLPWRKGMARIASQAGLAAQRGAPVYAGPPKRGVVVGKLQASTRTAVQQSLFPAWIAVRVRARNKGFSYPRLLEFSSRHRHRDWLINAVRVIFNQSESTLRSIGRELGNTWEKV